MEWFLATLRIALAAGLATTFDDNVYLTGFFGAVNRQLQPRHIVVGELLGFTVLLAISLMGYAMGLALPRSVLGLLGLLPILIGGRALVEQARSWRQSPDLFRLSLSSASTPGRITKHTADPAVNHVVHRSESQGGAAAVHGFAATRPSWLACLSEGQTYRVSMVTIANGSNNLSIYIPLFASVSLVKILVMIPVFYGLIATWLLLSFRLTRAPFVALALNRYMPNLFPFLLIWLGLRILLDSGSLRWLGLS